MKMEHWLNIFDFYGSLLSFTFVATIKLIIILTISMPQTLFSGLLYIHQSKHQPHKMVFQVGGGGGGIEHTRRHHWDMAQEFLENTIGLVPGDTRIMYKF